ncbi:MAG TPA: hypothetical protein VNY52_04750 [Solirubrobacteraceae bacterium]|nr:hypothetical protein [Solirubrobacteraceae bacterium]
MRVIAPSQLMREAAAVLEPIRDDVVVIGAVAVQVALDGQDVALTPARDVDAGVATEAAQRVVEHLQACGLDRSELAHERSFRWVKDDLKA